MQQVKQGVSNSSSQVGQYIQKIADNDNDQRT